MEYYGIINKDEVNLLEICLFHKRCWQKASGKNYTLVWFDLPFQLDINVST